ncbi:hypothetical protein ACHAWF_008927 [Thalassiosira exigua]
MHADAERVMVMDDGDGQARRSMNADALDRSYRAGGYIASIDVLSPSEASALRSAFDRAHPSSPPAGDERFKPHLFLPFVNEIVRNETIASTVQAVLRTKNVLLWSSDFNVKGPKSGGYFPLHQDATYTGLEPADGGVTVWLAVSDADEESGCMAFIEGSQEFGQLPHVEGAAAADAGDKDGNNMLSRKQFVDIDDHDACKGRRVIAALRAGQASLHHFHLLHQSGPNNSSRPRIGLALRYIAASVKQTGKVREAVTLISGRTEHDGFDLEPSLPLGRRASEFEIERGKTAHRDSMRREKENYFDSSAAVKEYGG